jgi:hypothetical protein
MITDVTNNTILLRSVNKNLIQKFFWGDAPNKKLLVFFNILTKQLEYATLQVFNGDETYEEKIQILKSQIASLKEKCEAICNTRGQNYLITNQINQLMEQYFEYFLQRLLQTTVHNDFSGRGFNGDATDVHPAEAIAVDSDVLTSENVLDALEELYYKKVVYQVDFNMVNENVGVVKTIVPNVPNSLFIPTEITMVNMGSVEIPITGAYGAIIFSDIDGNGTADEYSTGFANNNGYELKRIGSNVFAYNDGDRAIDISTNPITVTLTTNSTHEKNNIRIFLEGYITPKLSV